MEISARLKRHSTPALVWLFIIVVYIATLCPTLYLIDAGELTTVAYTLGIAHPTGYPLYTLLGRLFSLIPIGSIALRINLLSALISSFAGLIFFILVRKILKNFYLALIPTSLVVFSHTLWNTSLSAEVYPLTALAIALLLLLVSTFRSVTTIYLFFFFAGLAFSNHMTIFAVVLPVLLYIILRYRLTARQWFAGFVFFALGLSIYLYLPIRASHQPILNWGNPYSLERFLWHVTGKQYRVWMFSSPLAEVLANFKKEMFHIGFEWLYIFLPLIFLGLRNLLRSNRPLGLAYVSILILNILYAVNYSIPDIECYFLPTIFILGIISAYGLLSLKKFFRKGFALILALLPLVFHFTSSTMHNNYFGYDLGRNFLNSLPPRSIFFTDFWDIYSPTIYIRQVENKHRDQCIIDKELLRRSWYFLYLKKEYPEIYEKSEPEISSYLELLDDFEHNRLKSPDEIQRRYIRMIESFYEKNRDRRFFTLHLMSVYDDAQTLVGKLRIPYGLFYEITDTLIYKPFDYHKIDIRLPPFSVDERLSYDKRIYQKVVRDRMAYLSQIGKIEEVNSIQEWLDKNF